MAGYIVIRDYSPGPLWLILVPLGLFAWLVVPGMLRARGVRQDTQWMGPDVATAADCPDWRKRAMVAADAGTPGDVVARLARHDTFPNVLRAVCLNRRTGGESVRIAARRLVQVFHPEARPPVTYPGDETVRALLEAEPNRGRKDAVVGLVMDPQVQVRAQDALVHHGHWGVRALVALNPDVDEVNLTMLARDDDAVVARAAAETLRTVDERHGRV